MACACLKAGQEDCLQDITRMDLKYWSAEARRKIPEDLHRVDGSD